jgi:hypothetical protein
MFLVANRNISTSSSYFIHYITERFLGSLFALCRNVESQDYILKFFCFLLALHFLFKNPIIYSLSS